MRIYERPSQEETDRLSMPPGFIVPEIPYADVVAAANWLCQAFGFRKRLQIGGHRFQLTLANSSIVVVEGQETNPSFSLMLHVESVDQSYERATSMGAQIVNPPADYPFGERQCTVKDLGGHRWTFSQTIADVDPSSWGGTAFE